MISQRFNIPGDDRQIVVLAGRCLRQSYAHKSQRWSNGDSLSSLLVELSVHRQQVWVSATSDKNSIPHKALVEVSGRPSSLHDDKEP